MDLGTAVFIGVSVYGVVQGLVVYIFKSHVSNTERNIQEKHEMAMQGIVEKHELAEKSLSTAITEMKDKIKTEQVRSESGDAVLKDSDEKLRDIISEVKKELSASLEMNMNKVESEMQLRRTDVISLHNKVDNRTDQLNEKIDRRIDQLNSVIHQLKDEICTLERGRVGRD